jgi:hypothetical protein
VADTSLSTLAARQRAAKLLKNDYNRSALREALIDVYRTTPREWAAARAAGSWKGIPLDDAVYIWSMAEVVMTLGGLSRRPAAAAAGPRPPDKFRWGGKVCKGLAAREYALLEHLWQGGRPLPGVTFEDVRTGIIGDGDLTDGAVKAFVWRLDHKLHRAGISLGLGVRNCHVICAWNPP